MNILFLLASWFRRLVRTTLQSNVHGVNALPIDTKARIKAKILNQIIVATEDSGLIAELDSALTTSAPIRHPQLRPIVTLAKSLAKLPKVVPSVPFRERVYERLIHLQHRHTRGFFRSLAAACMLCIVIGGVALSSFMWQPQPTLAEVGYMQVAGGSVEVQRSHSSEEIPAGRSTVLRVGDSVRVPSDATASVNFVDSSRMDIRSNSEVQISHAKVDTLSIEKSTVRIAVLSGQVDATIPDKSTEDTPSTFEISTPTGIVGAQGGSVSVAVDTITGQSQVHTGSAQVAIATPNDTQVQVPAGATATLTTTTVLVAQNDISIPATSAALPLTPVGTGHDLSSPASQHKSTSDIIAAVPIPTSPVPALVTSQPLDITDIVGSLDVMQIRSFEALGFAEDGKAREMETIRTQVQSLLAQLTNRMSLVAGTQDALILQDALTNQYPDEPNRSIALQKLALVASLQTLLTQYSSAPAILTMFANLPHTYTPPADLRALYLAARTTLIVVPEGSVQATEAVVQGAVDTELTRLRTQGLTAGILRTWLKGMDNQPAYLPVLHAMRATIEPNLRYVVDKAISGMEKKAVGDKIDASNGAGVDATTVPATDVPDTGN